jgi:predicted ribosomally synthesized peptide with SipW-like signal peptide
MKSIFLSVVIICALAISGIGGTLATWSDSEVSFDNYVSTGSLDLKVNGEDDIGPHPDRAMWGNGVPAKVELYDMIPCKWYGPFEVELWNAGQYEDNENTFAHAFIHLKNIVCSNVLPKVDANGDTTGYPDPSTNQPWSGDLKPEPELVAEYGGKVDCIYVPGVGVEGDDCSVGTHVEMVITTTDVDPTTNDFDDILVNPDGYVMRDKLGKWECKEIWLFDLVPCNARTIYLWFHLQ